jgi:Holliday junction resolvasome RuvABC endonuclease subunit
MRILGIDCDSRKIAMVCMDGGEHIKFHILLMSHAERPKERLIELIGMFEHQLKAVKPEETFVEESIFIQNYATSRSISEIIGNIKYAVAKAGIDCTPVPVNTWKKVVIGKGNATKDDVKKFIVKKYPELENEMQDIFDAAAVCLYGIKSQKE